MNNLRNEYPNLKEIIVICKTHFDIGYTHSVKEIAHYYRTEMIEKAMDIMDQGKSAPAESRFAWTGPGWVMSKVFEEGEDQSKAFRERMEEYMELGRFKVHALPFTLESDACEPEEMARGFSFSSQLCRKYGMELPVSGKMTDVPSHGGALATVLANGGVKFLHIGCNWPSAYVTTPGMFWWEGPDGSRVLTFYSSIYGTAVGFKWSDEWGGGEPNVGKGFLPPKDWPYEIWPAILVTIDNSGPPEAEAFESLLKEAREKLPGVRIRTGTMDDFVNAFLKNAPELPVVKGEMPDTWVHGVMCDPRGMQAARRTVPNLAAGEALHTQLSAWQIPQECIADEVAAAHENILLYGEHTWGLASSVDEYGDAFANVDKELVEKLESSWKDKSDYIYKASEITDRILKDDLQQLASHVNAPEGDVIVYNPLPWERSGMVTIAARDHEKGNVSFWAEDVPPCGYKTYDWNSICKSEETKRKQQDTQTEKVLENSFYRITFDAENGCIASLTDKRTGREWVDSTSEHKLGQYLNERFTFEQTYDYTMTYQMNRAKDWPHPGMHKVGMISEKEVPYREAVNGGCSVSVNGTTAVIESEADPDNHMPGTVLKVTLDENSPFIDLEMTIQDKAKDNWPEADWLCLPFKVNSPQFRVYRQLGVMNPVTDILPGANRDLYSVGHGLTIADEDGAGIAICPLDHPLVSIDRPGCWKFSKDDREFIPRKPVVYLNLYNNQWNTNFRYWYPGTWSSGVRLWTFSPETAHEEVMAVPALEARNPLMAVPVKHGDNLLPPQRFGIGVSRKGVSVTAFGKNPDGDGILLRVWEQAGISGEIVITLPESVKFTSAVPVDLRGEKLGAPIEISEGKWKFKLNAYAPASFLLF